MTTLATAAAILALLVVIAVVAVAARSRSSYRAANQVVPGVKTSAPAAWAGAHTPEARLHRRLRDAVTALRAAAPDGGDATTAPFRTSVEREALALDERLVAVAALPERVRTEPLAEIAAAVDALEEAAAVLATSMAGGDDPLQRDVADVTERLRLLSEARAELDASWEQRTGAAAPREPGISEETA